MLWVLWHKIVHERMVGTFALFFLPLPFRFSLLTTLLDSIETLVRFPHYADAKCLHCFGPMTFKRPLVKVPTDEIALCWNKYGIVIPSPTPGLLNILPICTMPHPRVPI